MPEKRLVEGVFGDRLLFESVGMPPLMGGTIRFKLHVRPTELGLSPTVFGDADAILTELDDFANARAVEYKRVKITNDSLLTEQPIGLAKLRKAAHQTNALRRAGFAYVWLVVIVVADLRTITGGVGFAAIPGSIIKHVYDAIDFSNLDPSVGVSIHEIVQVSDRPANERGGAGGGMRRPATRIGQPESLTRAIKEVFVDSAT